MEYHPEAYCERCKRPNLLSWYADNDVWNSVVGSPNGVLCPICFAEIAETKGIGLTGWRLSLPDDSPELSKCMTALHDAQNKGTELWEETERLRAALLSIKTYSGHAGDLRRRATKALLGRKPGIVSELERQVSDLREMNKELSRQRDNLATSGVILLDKSKADCARVRDLLKRARRKVAAHGCWMTDDGWSGYDETIRDNNDLLAEIDKELEVKG